MSWLCGLFGHRWMDGLDTGVEQCDRCPKLRPKPPPPPPPGSELCPYPRCMGWAARPINGFRTAAGTTTYCFTACTECHRQVRWGHAFRPTPWGPDYKYVWEGPFVAESSSRSSADAQE